MFAAPLGASESDQVGQLVPVDRVKPAMFARDRHDDSMSHERDENESGNFAYCTPYSPI